MAVLSLPLAVSGAVCDLDGVLTNTARLHELAWATTMNAFLRERCRPREGDGRPFSHDDYRRHVDGLPREDGARAFLRARGLEAEQATVALLAARKDRHFEELLQEAAPGPLPGAVELLRALRARGPAGQRGPRHPLAQPLAHRVARRAVDRALPQRRVGGAVGVGENGVSGNGVDGHPGRLRAGASAWIRPARPGDPRPRDRWPRGRAGTA